jgi:hypothetical protein
MQPVRLLFLSGSVSLLPLVFPSFPGRPESACYVAPNSPTLRGTHWVKRGANCWAVAAVGNVAWETARKTQSAHKLPSRNKVMVAGLRIHSNRNAVAPVDMGMVLGKEIAAVGRTTVDNPTGLIGTNKDAGTSTPVDPVSATGSPADGQAAEGSSGTIGTTKDSVALTPIGPVSASEPAAAGEISGVDGPRYDTGPDGIKIPAEQPDFATINKPSPIPALIPNAADSMEPISRTSDRSESSIQPIPFLSNWENRVEKAERIFTGPTVKAIIQNEGSVLASKGISILLGTIAFVFVVLLLRKSLNILVMGRRA